MKAGESLGLASCHWARSTSSRFIERLSLILIQRLRKTSNINLCLSGHAHTYKQSKPGKKNCDPHQFCPVLTCKALSLYLVWEIRLPTLPVPREFMWGLFELILAQLLKQYLADFQVSAPHLFAALGGKLSLLFQPLVLLYLSAGQLRLCCPSKKESQTQGWYQLTDSLSSSVFSASGFCLGSLRFCLRRGMWLATQVGSEWSCGGKWNRSRQALTIISVRDGKIP